MQNAQNGLPRRGGELDYEKFKGKAEALKSQGHKGLIDRIIAKKYGTTEEGAPKQ